jgi:acetylglutamate kinase
VGKRGATVVKVGGSTWDSRDAALDDLVSLQADAWPLVVVHGGGDLISRWLEAHGVESAFVNGLRRTDEKALPIVVAVLAGLVNKGMVAGINALGGRAIGLSGADCELIRARRLPKLGFVGEIEAIRSEMLLPLLEVGYMPIVAPIAIECADEGLRPQLLNVNADTAAGEIALAVKAESLVFLTDVPGILDGQRQVVERLSAEQAAAMTEAGTIGGGMLPKVQACLRAAAGGTKSLIIDGRRPSALKAALEGQIAGTQVG